MAFKKSMISTAVGLSLAIGLSAGATAQTILFNDQFDVLNGVAQFDWAPSNVYAKNGNQAFVDFLNTGGACTGTATDCYLDIYSQGRLRAYARLNNTDIPSTNGSNYEITYTMHFRERVSLAVPGVAVFDYVPDASNTFQMWYDTSIDSSDLTGVGFDDGLKIMEGHVSPYLDFISSFLATTSTSLIGGAGSVTPAAWAGQKTVVGAGSTTTLDLLTAPTYLDPAFFITPLTSFRVTNISQIVPYTTVDPALSFPWAGIVTTQGAGGVGTVNGGTNLTIGGCGNNGIPTAPSAVAYVACGPSVLFQTDTNSPVTGERRVPEPATLALLGLGLAGLGAMRRRKQA